MQYAAYVFLIQVVHNPVGCWLQDTAAAVSSRPSASELHSASATYFFADFMIILISSEVNKIGGKVRPVRERLCAIGSAIFGFTP